MYAMMNCIHNTGSLKHEIDLNYPTYFPSGSYSCDTAFIKRN